MGKKARKPLPRGMHMMPDRKMPMKDSEMDKMMKANRMSPKKMMKNQY